MRPDASRVYRQYLDAVGLNGQAHATAAGLPASDWYALSVLDLAGSLTSGELARRTGLTTGATTRLINRLERGGHARRVADPADRRRVVVEPLSNPDLDIDEVVGPARRRIAEVLSRYTPEQLDVLFDYFTHATPAFREATDEIRQKMAHRRRKRPSPPSLPATST